MRTVLVDDATKFLSDAIERLVPCNLLAANFGMQQTAVESERFTERGAFGAQLAAIGRVIWITRDFYPALFGSTRQNAATHPAVWASGTRGFFHFAKAAPNKSLSRNAPTLRPSCISSKYHGPSVTSPYRTAPRTLSFSMTIRL